MSARKNPSKISCVSKIECKKYEIDWTIDDIRIFLKEENRTLESPNFKTGSGTNEISWHLSLYPKGFGDTREGYISFLLCLVDDINTIFVKHSLSIVNKKHVELKSASKKLEFNEENPSSIFINFISLSDLCCEESEYLDEGMLRILCKISIVEYGGALTEDKCNLQSKSNQLSNDLSSLLNSSKLSDFVFLVGEKEFNVHKAILAARSPVFAELFNDNQHDNESKSFVIEDVDEEAFQLFLLYIYTGECPSLEEKAADLLPLSSKYNIKCLKELCETIVSEQLDTKNISDNLILADKHNADYLMNKVLDFMCNDGTEIFQSDAWKTLVSNQPQLALKAYGYVIEDWSNEE